MRSQRIACFLLLSAAAFAAQGANLDFNLASNAAAVDFTTNLTESGLEGDLLYLHHTNKVDIGAAGVDLVGNASPVGSPLLFGVGAKLFYINPKGGQGSGSAVGVGAHVRYTWPSYNRIILGGQLYYAPNIVSFQNVSHFMLVSVDVGYEVLRNADVYVGYRHVTGSFNGSQDVTLDTSFMIGMNLTF